MSIPRGEYPRPHLVRDATSGRGWLSLNGTWQFRFGDPSGCENGASLPADEAFDRAIVVPFPWESFAAWGLDAPGARDYNESYLCAEAYPDPRDATIADRRYHRATRHEVGWYRRSVTVPEEMRSGRVFLIFGAVDHKAEVWVGDAKVCEHEGGYAPFETEITSHIPPTGEITITVRAEDPQDHLDQPAGKQIGWYERASGIWQSVWLESRGPTYVERVRIVPDVESRSVWVALALAGDLASGLEVAATVYDAEGKPVAQEQGGVEGASAAFSLGIRDAHLWEPTDPYRYRVELAITSGGAISDRVHVPFGMRSVGIGTLPGTDTPTITLNGRPIYLNGVLAQNYNPFGVYTYPTVEMMVEDIERAKSAGFNMIRIHIKAEDPVFLDLADEFGTLVMYDLPCFGRYTALARQRYEAMLRALVDRDFNHPSIFAWVLFNETWGLGGEDYRNHPERHDWVRSMVELVRILDPTRLVEDNSPCLYDHVETDINSWHFYLRTQAETEQHIQSVVDSTYPGSQHNFVPGYVQGNQPLMNSEYGGIDAGMGDMDVSWCFHFQTNTLRRHERISGYVYTELQDIEWERNGFLNYDRTPKEFGYDPSFINGPDVLVLDAPLGGVSAAGATVLVPAYASLFSRDEVPAARLGWQVDITDVTGRTRQAVTEGQRDVAAQPYRVTPLGEIAFELPSQPGLARLFAWLEAEDGLLLARNWLHRRLDGELQSDRPVPLLGEEWVGFDGVEEEPGVWKAGRGSGELRFEFTPPSAADAARGFSVIAELSAWRPGYKQTDSDTHPTDMAVLVGGTRVETITLPDSPCDARGVLSGIAGRPCKYGYRVEIPIRGARARRILSSQAPVPVVFRVAHRSKNVGGLALYPRTGGRYPIEPCVVIGDPRGR